MQKIYRFGPFTLDSARRRLHRDDEDVSVPPKALDVLVVLLESRGRTVEKDDLMARVWSDTVVEETNLTQSIFMLRRALEDDASEPRYVATVARRGYRFVANATETEAHTTTFAPSDEERRRIEARGTASVEAYHAYLRGRHYWGKRQAEDLRRAITCFRQAIDLDPIYARAYVGLAECFVILKTLGWPTAPDALISAKAAASKALEIDDSIAEAHATLGIIRMCSDRDWPGAESSLRRAIDLAPDYAVARNWYANYLAASRRLDEAVVQARQAVHLDPLSVIWRAGVGHMLFLGRHYQAAIETELNVLEMDPKFAVSYWILGMAYEQSRDIPRAIDALRQADKFSGGNLLMRGLLGRILAVAGQIAESHAILNALTTSDRLQTPPEAVALVYAGLGDVDNALEWFHRAAREGSFLVSFVNVSPLFDALRKHAAFGALQQLVHLG